MEHFRDLPWHDAARIMTSSYTKWQSVDNTHWCTNVCTNHESKLPPNFWSLKGKSSVRSGSVINEQKYINCWLCSSRKKKMTAINIISVGVNCPELTQPKASWQTDGGEETHSFHSLGWDSDIYSTGKQQGGIAGLSILIAVTVRNSGHVLLC